MAPSRNSIRLLAEREETMRSGGAGLGVSPPPVPASMAKTQDSSELDVDMMDDVTLLASMLRGNFLDVQADAATAVAGLTADRELTINLSAPICASVSEPCILSSLCWFVSVLNISLTFLLGCFLFRVFFFHSGTSGATVPGRSLQGCERAMHRVRPPPRGYPTPTRSKAGRRRGGKPRYDSQAPRRSPGIRQRGNTRTHRDAASPARVARGVVNGYRRWCCQQERRGDRHETGVHACPGGAGAVPGREIFGERWNTKTCFEKKSVETKHVERVLQQRFSGKI